jgi:hypothetical protein
MLTIAIIFTLLVALWGHWSAVVAARPPRDGDLRPDTDGDSTQAGPMPPVSSSGH